LEEGWGERYIGGCLNDHIEGKLGEIAFARFLKEHWGIGAEVDLEVRPGIHAIDESDVKTISIGNVKRSLSDAILKNEILMRLSLPGCFLRLCLMLSSRYKTCSYSNNCYCWHYEKSEWVKEFCFCDSPCSCYCGPRLYFIFVGY
jgi:hypothetical protein